MRLEFMNEASHAVEREVTQRTGHGTPAPIAPPKRLVVPSFYRHVRYGEHEEY